MRHKEYRSGSGRRCVNILLLVLLLLLPSCLHCRPLHNEGDGLIDGHDFLKLFLERDERPAQEFNSDEYQGQGDATFTQPHASAAEELSGAGAGGYDVPSTGRSIRSRTAPPPAAGKQLAKLVTTGSKIVFPDDELDDESLANDVVAGAGIELQKDFAAASSAAEKHPNDGIRVVAVSVSSSSQRGGRRHYGEKVGGGGTHTATPATPHVKTTTVAATPSTTDFINRSHKSELAIDELEPMTVSKRKGRLSKGARHFDPLAAEPDAEHSASTNVRNVLDAPLAVRNATHFGGPMDAAGSASTTVEDDKFIQTVIYHDTKEGPHGPQSRSISYSSIAQNVEDFTKQWQRSSGSLVEAQRNVNESLSPLLLNAPRPPTDNSEPSKFYSVPAKMYGLPSKFYSEPAKVYSEPSKVYSQPSRVYGEPSRTYWSLSTSTTSSTSTSSTTTTTTPAPLPTTTMPSKSPAVGQAPPYQKYGSRRPAIVSRIAFGEAQAAGSTTSTTTTSTAAPPVAGIFGHKQPHLSLSSADSGQQHHQHQHHQHHPPAYHSPNQRTRNGPGTQPRRILFNLDKLPYDLLNAPEPSSTYLLDPALSESPPAAVTYSSPRERTCLEAAFAASAQQHSAEQQPHSNHQQNAKGLSNEDLVRCVSKFGAAATTDSTASGIASPHRPHSATGESDRHPAALATAAPEHNYEIEESVSVMTNGRAHATSPAPPPATAKPTRSRLHYNNNIHHNTPRTGLPFPLPSHAHLLANANGADYAKDVTDGDGDQPIYSYNEHHQQHQQQQQQQQQQHHQQQPHHQNRHHKGDDDEDDDSKSYYVEEGSNYRKYRVEEKTDDGFIVGEYGVVDHNDGNLRGVRYTADSTINPSLIQKALLTFLKLK